MSTLVENPKQRTFVYFGSLESLNAENKQLKSVAIFERFVITDSAIPVYFYYNSENRCEEANGFKEKGVGIALYLHPSIAAAKL